MELWIRSQDKNLLIKADNLCIMENRIVFIPRNNNGRVSLGTYESNKRAVEILDDIQAFLKPMVSYRQKEPITNDLGNGFYQIRQNVDFKIQELSTNIYQMPKE